MPGGSSVDGAYLIESAAQLCGDAFGAGVVAAVRRGARRSDVLGLLRAPRLHNDTTGNPPPGSGDRCGSVEAGTGP